MREYHRTQALTALANRYKSKGLAPLSTKPARKRKKAKPLFVPEDDEVVEVVDDGDPEMALAIQESLELEEEASLRRAIEESKAAAATSRLADVYDSSAGASSSRTTLDTHPPVTPARAGLRGLGDAPDDSDDDLYASPMRLETALSFANTGPKRSPTKPSDPDSPFGRPTLLLGPASPTAARAELPTAHQDTVTVERPISESETELKEIEVAPPVSTSQASVTPASTEPIAPTDSRLDDELDDESDDDMEPVVVLASQSDEQIDVRSQAVSPADASKTQHLSQFETPSTRIMRAVDEEAIIVGDDDDVLPTVSAPAEDTFLAQRIESSDSESDDDWSRVPSAVAPVEGAPVTQEAVEHEQPSQPEAHDGAWDAAHEMDPQAEEGEFARFMSQVRGRNLDDVRREIDDEIRALNQQKKVAMRDSEDVTQQMVSQIMVRLRLCPLLSQNSTSHR